MCQKISIDNYSSKLTQLKDSQRNIDKNNKIKIDLTCCNIIAWMENVGEIRQRIIKVDQKDDINIIWADTYVTQQLIKRLKPYQKVNHFPGSQQLGKKNSLSVNLNAMKKLLPQQYSFFPRTWVLPSQSKDYIKFRNENPNLMYIVKPCSSCQGKGIYLTNNAENHNEDEIVVQEYIQKPLLIQDLKFDFRIYVLLKSLTPLKIFIYEEGLARLATQKYQLPSDGNLQNMNMHLTNYAINKLNLKYIPNKNQYEDNIGHKRSYSALMHKIKQLGCDINKLQIQIDEIIVKTIFSSYQKLLKSYKNCRDTKQQIQSVCFEVFGFDIMISQDFKPYLIEVNHTPSFCTDTPLDFVIKKHLILDTLNILNMDHQMKINFIKQRSQQNKAQSWIQSFEIKKGKIINQINQKQILGCFRKIYPGSNYLTNIFKKINQQLQEKIIKRRLKPQIISTCKRRQKQIAMTLQPSQINNQYNNNLNLTFYNLLNGKNINYHQQQINLDRDDNKARKTLHLDKDKKKNFKSIKLNNINIDFSDALKQRQSYWNNDQSNQLSQKIPYSNRVISSTPTGYDNIFQKYQSPYYRQDRFKFHQRFYESELKSKINKIKMARIRLHRIRKIDKRSIGSDGQINNI